MIRARKTSDGAHGRPGAGGGVYGYYLPGRLIPVHLADFLLEIFKRKPGMLIHRDGLFHGCRVIQVIQLALHCFRVSKGLHRSDLEAFVLQLRNGPVIQAVIESRQVQRQPNIMGLFAETALFGKGLAQRAVILDGDLQILNPGIQGSLFQIRIQPTACALPALLWPDDYVAIGLAGVKPAARG